MNPAPTPANANDLTDGRKHMEGLQKLKPIALLFLRLALGMIFIFHGYPKLFTHPQQTAEAFAKMGFPGYFAYLAGVFEFFGGIMLLVGLFKMCIRDSPRIAPLE